MGNPEKQSGVPTFQVNEIFNTVQGEGYLAGTKASFVRLQGCPVGCEWCDTKYTWKAGGTKMTVAEIIGEVSDYANFVVITGGEPLLYDLDPLLAHLHQIGFYTQVETSGLHWYKGGHRARWTTVSPKPPLKYRVPVEFHRYANEFKWVVDNTLTWERVWNAWKMTLLERPKKVGYPVFTLMPEGSPPRDEMVQKAIDLLNCVPFKITQHWRLGDRLQYRIGVK